MIDAFVQDWFMVFQFRFLTGFNLYINIFRNNMATLFIPILLVFVAVHLSRATILRTSCTTDAEFSIIHKYKRVTSIFTSFTQLTWKQCIIKCMIYNPCVSLNFQEDIGNCELSQMDSNNGTLISAPGWVHTESNPIRNQGEYCSTVNPCPYHDYCVSLCVEPWYECKCKNKSYAGDLCLSFPCQNHGTCLETCNAPGYVCSCTHPYSGLNCGITNPNGESYTVPGSISSVSVGGSSKFDHVTACTWFKVDAAYASNMEMYVFTVYHYEKQKSCRKLSIRVDHDRITLYAEDRNTHFNIQLLGGRWYHVCGVVRYTCCLRIYLNGALLHQDVTADVQYSQAAYGLFLGRNMDKAVCIPTEENRMFYGSIKLLYVWKRELSSTEILEVFKGRYQTDTPIAQL